MNLPCEVRHLVRTFGRASQGTEVRAVDDVSFSVPSGQVTAIVGVNGAGKTTLFRMCSTLLAPTSGQILINGIDAVQSPYRARGSLGLSLGGDRGFYPQATVRDNLLFFADLANISSQKRVEEVDTVIERVQLTEKRNAKAATLSRGQYQWLHIARALLGSPSLIILDEPTSGLDPDIALNVRSLIATIANDGTAVLLSSHSMEEVSELATQILLLSQGKIVARGSVNDIVAFAGLRHVTTMKLDATHPVDFEYCVATVPGLAALTTRPAGSKWLITAYWNNFTADACHHLRSIVQIPEGKDVEEVQRPAHLEDAFLYLSSTGN